MVQAIAIHDGVITLVGTNQEIKESINETTEVIDLKGKMMMPSFHDAHSHPVWSGVDQLKCVVSESYDIDIMQAQLEECLTSELTKRDWMGSGNPIKYRGISFEAMWINLF